MKKTLLILTAAALTLTSCANPDEALAFGDRVLTYAEATGKVDPAKAQLGRDLAGVLIATTGAKATRKVLP